MPDIEDAAVEAAQAKIEEGLREWAAAFYGPNFVLTDWIVSANTIDMEGDGSATRYMRPSSIMPIHVAKGLLHQTLDTIREQGLVETMRREAEGR